jgi:hypothetical protein
MSLYAGTIGIEEHAMQTSTGSAGAVICRVAAIAVALTVAASGGSSSQVKAWPSVANKEERTMVTDSRFYCNVKALNPAERAHQKQLTDKLIAKRKEIVESEYGYEFQFDPRSISLGELADWVVAESKCCPFFDFHIDLEREGHLLCLRLTGADGVKAFIRSEFQAADR